jgi:hypothetical protein
MQTRSFVVAIALVLALAVAAPTIGATNNRGSVADRALEVAKDAQEVAKTAKRAANKARGDARTALSVANSANAAATSAANKADAASTAAGAAGTKADAASTAATGAAAKADAVAADLAATKVKSATANGTVTTASETSYEDLGGPSVTITVPPSGLIEVWAQATMTDGAVSLFEGNQQVPDQDPNGFCGGGGTPPPAGPLLSLPGGGPPGPATLSTPGGPSFLGCGSGGPPSSVLLTATPGERTFSLRYASCGCNAPTPAEISGRFLAVAPRP